MKKSIFISSLFVTAALMSAQAWGHDHAAAADQPQNAHSHGHMTGMNHGATGADKGSDNVRVESCWIRLLPAAVPSGGYFQLHNDDTAKSATLTHLETEAFATTMLHQTTEQDRQSRMDMVHTVQIDPGQTLEFKPGSYHAMFEKPAAGLKVGDKVTVNFVLGTGKKLPTECLVKAPNARTYAD